MHGIHQAHIPVKSTHVEKKKYTKRTAEWKVSEHKGITNATQSNVTVCWKILGRIFQMENQLSLNKICTKAAESETVI